MLARGAEHAERGVALKLVDPSSVNGHDVHDDPEEAIERLNHISRVVIGYKGGRADQVDEQHRGVTGLASELKPSSDRRTGDLFPHVAPEEITHAIAFSQPGEHPVEPRLQQPHFARVIDGHDHIRLAGLHPRHRFAHRAQRVHDRVDRRQQRDQSDRQSDRAEEDHGLRHALRRNPRPSQVGDRHHDRAADGDRRAELPCKVDARGNSRQHRAVGRIGLKGQRRCRPHDPLHSQIAERRRGQASQHDHPADKHPRRRGTADRHVKRPVHRARQRPDDEGVPRFVQRQSHGLKPLGLIRVSAAIEPCPHGSGDAQTPHVAHDPADCDADCRPDQVDPPPRRRRRRTR